MTYNMLTISTYVKECKQRAAPYYERMSVLNRHQEKLELSRNDSVKLNNKDI